MEILYCASPAELEALCRRLRDAPALAVDTEFLREKTYHARLCLLQLASDELVAVVDPLAVPDLSPLLDVLYAPSVLKVMHAARQDLEILHRLRGRPPAPVYDTQLAAALLGHPEQVGYGALVAAELGVELDKGQARTDWARRPLEPEQLAYAADDVRYLLPLYRRQQAALAARGRSGWLEEDMAALSDPAAYDEDPEAAWRRVKGAARLAGGQRAVLQALAAWRERTAAAADRPRRWILGDEVLLDLARRMPRDRRALGRVRGLSEGFLARHGDEVLACIARARALPRERWPAAPPARRPDPAAEALADVLMAVVRLRAAEAEVAPAVLATRRDLERVARGERDGPLFRGWRRELVGRWLADFLDGGGRLRVADGLLSLEG